MQLITLLFFCMSLILGSLSSLVYGESGKPEQRGSNEQVALFGNLGTLHHPITTSQPRAQQYFDQGLRLIYAFNHEEAVRAFEEAARIDPNAAMAYWGIAYALGPNINAPMLPEQERRAYEAVQKAKALSAKVTPQERAYIDALAVRYSLSSNADRKALDQTYAEAMRKVSQRYPDDVDAATLFAESLMDLRPWDYWTLDGQAHLGTQEIVSVLEEVLKRSPDHIGACHYYIHAVEAWQPVRALPCAERLPSLAPGAGHLVHKPSHIYIRVGKYDKATERNAHAVSADQRYLEGRHLSGIYPLAYYPHNIHFLWSALTMQGRSGEALKAARDLMGVVSLDVIRQVPDMEFFVPTPLFALVRFGQWEDILREPSPPPDLHYSVALWHYARGLALTAKGQLDQAEEERQKLNQITAAMPAERIVGLNSAAKILKIASHAVSAQIAAKRGQTDEAIRHFEDAVVIQDGLRYYEPPEWYYPVRESLGAVLLSAGRAAEAETVYRQDLKRTPENPWSLHGLVQSLRAQHRDKEAAAVEERFQRAWSQADLELHPSRFEAFLAAQSG